MLSKSNTTKHLVPRRPMNKKNIITLSQLTLTRGSRNRWHVVGPFSSSLDVVYKVADTGVIPEEEK